MHAYTLKTMIWCSLHSNASYNWIEQHIKGKSKQVMYKDFINLTSYIIINQHPKFTEPAQKSTFLVFCFFSLTDTTVLLWTNVLYLKVLKNSILFCRKGGSKRQNSVCKWTLGKYIKVFIYNQVACLFDRVDEHKGDVIVMIQTLWFFRKCFPMFCFWQAKLAQCFLWYCCTSIVSLL